MDKVIFFEAEEHHEVVTAYIESFLTCPDLVIEVHCNKQVKVQISSQLSNRSISWKKLNDPILSSSAFRKQLVIITSPLRKYKISVPLGIEIYYVLHNLHASFAPHRQVAFHSLKSPFAAVKTIYHYHHQWKLLQKCTGFIFLNENITRYYKNHYSKDFPDTIALTLPTFRRLPNPSLPKESNKNVIILGSYDPTRRDHQPIFDMLRKEKFADIYFTFLGQIPERLSRSLPKQTKNKIKCFPDELNAKQYYQALQKADLLILPLKREKYYGGVRELFGHTTFSALWMDVFSSGIPTALPQYLPIDREFREYLFPFSDAVSLSDIVQQYFLNYSPDLLKSFGTKSRNIFEKQIHKAMETIFA